MDFNSTASSRICSKHFNTMTMLWRGKKCSFDHNTSPETLRGVDDFNIKYENRITTPTAMLDSWKLCLSYRGFFSGSPTAENHKPPTTKHQQPAGRFAKPFVSRRNAQISPNAYARFKKFDHDFISPPAR